MVGRSGRVISEVYGDGWQRSVCSKSEADAANPDFRSADPIVSSGMNSWEARAFGGRSKRRGLEEEDCVCECVVRGGKRERQTVR